ncbi:CHAT domain-containing protein [Frankia sp. CiP3]|uniref:CHAT domain-containing protein n=1 Tax=Frankia sp. CiP3 TaxID=2880971 RepID=UPI001EF711D7|nr:CHAT domain-containing protein [Frankia sp. CiP3]
MPLDDLTWRIRDRIEQYDRTRQVAEILDADADRDAAALWRLLHAVDLTTSSPALDAAFSIASAVLGRLHHRRYQVLPAGAGLPELARCVLCLEPISDDHEAVPSELVPVVGRFTDPDVQVALGVQLLDASAGSEDPALLDAAILLLAPAATARQGRGPGRTSRLSALSAAYRRRHERDGTTTDLDRAVGIAERALRLADRDGEAPEVAVQVWTALARAYRCRYRQHADPADLRRVIDLSERTLAHTGPSADQLADLATAYLHRHEHTDSPADLERAVDLAEDAAALPGGQEDPDVLSALGRALLRHYDRSGQRSELWRAATLAEQAAATLSPRDPRRATYLSTAAATLLRRHERSRALDDLNRAVDLGRQALAAMPETDPARAHALGRLAAALHRRHLSAGADTDLDQAEDLASWALAAIPPGHPDRSSAALERAAVHLTRYRHSGVTAELARAIELGEQVTATNSAPPPRWWSLLGDAYQQRHAISGELADLDRAVELGERALAATREDDVARAERYSRLATAHWRRHSHAPGGADLDRAIELRERAVADTPADHLDLPDRLADLAAAHLDRYRLTGATADLDSTVTLCEQALEALPVDHPHRFRFTASMCVAYLQRIAGGGPAPDRPRLLELADGMTGAQCAAAPAGRVSAHHAMGRLAQTAGQPALALTMLDAAAALLPSVAPREAGWADQQYRLGEHGGLVGAGVAAHCAAGDPAGAVEFAELGRGVLLASQANTRVDLDELDDRAPRLAARFRWVCERLNTPDFPARERRRWWADYDRLLSDIRALPGLTHFVAAPRLAELAPAAAGGCVILINADTHRSDAILLRADTDPVAVALPDLRPSDVNKQVTALLATLNSGSSLAAAYKRGKTLRALLGWLWDVIAAPVAAALPHHDTPQRVWWLPTGLLGLLPLHAAGHPGQDGALDIMISSYIPSLRALQAARNRPPARRRQSLSVVMSATPDMKRLPGAEEEAAVVGGPSLFNADATADQVLTALRETTWAHFACHGVVNATSQVDSGLRVHDRILTLPEIGGLRLTDAELAYLSACSTANHGTRYADEVLHPAAAFQLAGFRHVVASLWPLRDDIAPDAARAFYQHFADTPVADQAAPVLRAVTLRLRDRYPERPDLWAPLVHSGP